MGSLVVVAGHAGVGKSTVGQTLCEHHGWTFIDKDTVTSPLVNALMESLTGDGADRHSQKYLAEVRPIEYQATLAVAMEALRHGSGTVVLVAPCGAAGDLTEIELRCKAEGHHLSGLWITCDEDTWKGRLVRRASPRDRHKVVGFKQWVEGLQSPTLPAWMETLDTSGRWSDRLALLIPQR